jgi:hypothetical protein
MPRPTLPNKSNRLLLVTPVLRFALDPFVNARDEQEIERHERVVVQTNGDHSPGWALPQILGMPDVEAAAVCDKDAERLERFGIAEALNLLDGHTTHSTGGCDGISIAAIEKGVLSTS